MASHTAPEFVLRPFEGLPGEADWVALREVVPAATATARTTAEHGARDVLITTNLPGGWPALHRGDGVVLLALQNQASTGDASRELAANLLAAFELEPGTSLTTVGLPGSGPRLQDILDLTVPFEVTVHEGFDYWLEPDQEVSDELRASLDDAAAGVIPTVKLASVDAAYLATFGSRRYVRWSWAVDEEKLIDAIARLHARREARLGDARFLGAFRSSGIVVPVWDIESKTTVEEIETAAVALEKLLTAALAEDAPLDANERRARAGIVARQLTLR